MRKLIIADLISRMANWRLLLIGALFILIACNGQKKASTQKNSEAKNGELELLLSDSYSGAEVSETLIIKDVKTLKRFFSKLNMTRKPGLSLPEIDFKKSIVIITCSGERNDGLSPILRVKEETTSQLVLSTALKSDKQSTSQAITTPFSIYKMPLTDKEIIFKRAEP